MEVASYLVGKLKGRVLVNAGKRPYLSVRMNGKKPLEVIQEVLEISNFSENTL